MGKSNKLYCIIGVTNVIIAIIGFLVTVVLVFVVKPNSNRIRDEISRLRSETEEVQLRDAEVLDQASDIVLRANMQAQGIADWANAIRANEPFNQASPLSLFDEETGSVLYANYKFPSELLPDAYWKVVSHEVVDTYELPTLWFLMDDVGTIYATAFGNYNVETGQYTDAMQGACGQLYSAEFALYGNTPAGD